MQTILLENYTTKQHKFFTQSSRRNTPDSWGKPHQDSEPQTCPPTHNRKVANSEKTKPKKSMVTDQDQTGSPKQIPHKRHEKFKANPNSGSRQPAEHVEQLNYTCLISPKDANSDTITKP
jgi:hypothetical protein